MTAQIISAVPLPFDSEGELDLDGYAAMLREIDPYIDAALVAGTTGEFPALEDSERLAVFQVSAEVLGAERVIAHLGHASSRQVRGLAQQTAALGIDRFALLTPYYLPTDADGVVAFYADLLEAVPSARVYAYLFPERTGIDVEPHTLARVLALPGMVGVKLSGAASSRLPEYAAVMGQMHELYSGDDGSLPWVMAHGGTGVVSGVSSAFPRTFAALARALSTDPESAADIQERVSRIVPEVGSTIARLKAAMQYRYGGSWASRMSLPGVGADTHAVIERLVADHG